MFANRFSLPWSCFALLAAPLVLTGCGGKSDSGGGGGNNVSTGGEKPKTDTAGFMQTSSHGTFGKGFVEAAIADPKSFNLVVAKETSTTSVLGQMFDSLVVRKADTLELENALAESYTTSKDGKVWTFELRKGVKWSDGQPFTADDVIFTFDMIYDPNNGASARDIYLVDDKPVQYKKIDDTTVEITLPHPFGPFIDTIAGVTPIPKHKLEADYKAGKFPSAWSVSTPPADIVGTGPFILADYKPGQYVKYKRNPYYWRLNAESKQLPFFDGGTTEIVPDLNATLLKFKNKETDYFGVRPEDWSDIKAGAASGDYTTADVGPNWGFSYISFNQNPRATGLPDYKREWFAKKEFRQAVSYAIDRDRIVKTVLRGLGRPLWSPVSPANTVFYNDKVAKYLRDVAKAKSLLAGIGFKPGPEGYLQDAAGHPLEFTLLTNTGNNINIAYCTIIQENLKEVGIKVNPTPVEFNSLVTRLNSTYDWEACVLAFTGGVEVYNGRNIWASSGQLHMWNPKQTAPATPWEAEIDSLFVEAGKTVDQDKRKQIYARFQDIAAEQLPLIYLATSDVLLAYKNQLVNTKPSSQSGAGVRWNLYELSDK